MGSNRVNWMWEHAGCAEEVHELLLRSDAFQATADAPPPARNFETTSRGVSEGAIHVLRADGEAAGMFTLIWVAPYPLEATRFPPAQKPAYLMRLAIDPKWLKRDVLIGARCIRRALQVAGEAGADVLRAEANPKLDRVTGLLKAFGFSEFGRAEFANGSAGVYLQASLTEPP